MYIYFLLVFRQVSQEPYCLIFDTFSVSIGKEKLGIDDIMVVFWSSVRGLVIDQYFWRSFWVKKQFNLLSIGFVWEYGFLNDCKNTLTISSLSPKESAMQPRIQKNFLDSYLLIQIKLKVIFFVVELELSRHINHLKIKLFSYNVHEPISIPLKEGSKK